MHPDPCLGHCVQVVLARVVETGELVALKRIYVRAPQEGVPDNLVREIKSLQAIDHPNVIPLLNVHVDVRDRTTDQSHPGTTAAHSTSVPTLQHLSHLHTWHNVNVTVPPLPLHCHCHCMETTSMLQYLWLLAAPAALSITAPLCAPPEHTTG